MALKAATITTLKNGLRVATTPRKGTAGVELLVGAGSRHDSVLGSASLFGSQLWGGKGQDKAKLETAMCDKGSFTCEVGREETSFTMNVATGSVGTAIDLLGACAQPTITDKDVATAKVAHLKSIESDDMLIGPKRGGTTEDVLIDRLHVSCFRDSTLGNPVLGTVDDVQTITGATLSQFVADNYAANSMVLTVAGDVDHASVVKAAEAAFGKIAPKTLPPVLGKPYFLSAELLYRNDEMGPNGYFAGGFEGVPLLSSDSVAFDLFAQIIGDYEKTRVYTVPPQISGNRVRNEVANKMDIGCSEYFKAFNLQYSDTGLFGFFTVFDELAAEHCVGELIWGCNMLSHSVTDEEVARAKRELKLSYAQKTAANAAAAKKVGKDVLVYGRHITPEEYNMRVDAIDAEEVKRVAWKYLHDGLFSATALGPLHGLPDLMGVGYGPHLHRYMARY
jgi:processing peptidase subunit beta